MKAAAQLVIHPARGHRQQRMQHHVASFVVARALPVAQQKIMYYWPRKLRRPTETAKPRIKTAAKHTECRLEDRIVEPVGGGAANIGVLLEFLDHLLARFDDFGAVTGPRVGDVFEHRFEAGPSVA